MLPQKTPLRQMRSVCLFFHKKKKSARAEPCHDKKEGVLFVYSNSNQLLSQHIRSSVWPVSRFPEMCISVRTHWKP